MPDRQPSHRRHYRHAGERLCQLMFSFADGRRRHVSGSMDRHGAALQHSRVPKSVSLRKALRVSRKTLPRTGRPVRHGRVPCCMFAVRRSSRNVSMLTSPTGNRFRYVQTIHTAVDGAVAH